MERADQRKYHIIYKTTCLITGKWYIGMHSTNDLNDGYLGSGQRLWKSINKYGKQNHKCEILEFLPSRKDLILRESQIVTPELKKDPLCMNIANGGVGLHPGFKFGQDLTEKRREASLKMHSQRTEEKKNAISLSISIANKIALNKPETKPAQSEAAKKRWEDPKYRESMRLVDRTHSEEAKKKMSIAKLGKKIQRTPEHNAKIAAAHKARALKKKET